MKNLAYNIYLNNRIIDTVFYNYPISTADLKKELVNRDNYSQKIVVRKRRK